MKFGQVWDLSTGTGDLVVMLLVDRDPLSPIETGVVSAVILYGWTLFDGGGSYPGGYYGPGDIGPVKFGEGELRDDASP